MTDITIRKNGNQPTAAVERPRNPWGSMRSLLSWDPFRDLTAFAGVDEGAFAMSPAFDVKETKEGYEFKADVPGIQDKDLDVSMTGNRLTVSGKRDAEKEERGERHYTYERSYGSFTRSFSLPDGVDASKVQASLDKGVLTVVVPKTPEVQPKKIPVKSETPSIRS